MSDRMVVHTVSCVVSPDQDSQGCSGAALVQLSGFKTGENKTSLRIYGFEGEAGGRGEVRTRICESKRWAGRTVRPL